MKRSVCLNMIVKDESPVIKRCLASVKYLIDYWVIVDTGSSDGTQDIVRETMRDIPGELHERPWVDFSHNRNEALQLAKTHADYILFLDADEFLVLDEGASLAPQDADVYFCPIYVDTFFFHRKLMVADRLDWKWMGAIHEVLICPELNDCEFLSGIRSIATNEGKRARSGYKLLRDTALMEKDLEKDPTCLRKNYYLALQYALIGDFAKGIVQCKKRISMGGDPELLFITQLALGEMQEKMLMDPEIFLQSYVTAYQMRPTRSEPLYFIARHFLKAKKYLLAFLITKLAQTIPYPNDYQYVRFSIYDYELAMLWAESSYALGKINETCDAYRKLIDQFETYLNRRELSREFLEKIAEILPGMKQFVVENQ
ncbi:MAG: hypothetical protein HW387_1269 [Parachlamydiales bacterium]|nr:hypothetical protein [Parachlamydiales bacterium]